MVASSVSKQCAIFLSQVATDGHRSDNEVLSKGTLSQISPIDRAHLGHRCAHLFYACADSSEWGLFGRCARSAFRRTPSGRVA